MSFSIVLKLDDSWSFDEADDAAKAIIESSPAPFVGYEIISRHCGKCEKKDAELNTNVDKKFFEVSLINLPFPIQSQWQAHFLQVFPFDIGKLPYTHESDEKVFNECYEGKKKMTFQEFVSFYYAMPKRMMEKIND